MRTSVVQSVRRWNEASGLHRLWKEFVMEGRVPDHPESQARNAQTIRISQQSSQHCLRQTLWVVQCTPQTSQAVRTTCFVTVSFWTMEQPHMSAMIVTNSECTSKPQISIFTQVTGLSLSWDLELSTLQSSFPKTRQSLSHSQTWHMYLHSKPIQSCIVVSRMQGVTGTHSVVHACSCSVVTHTQLQR